MRTLVVAIFFDETTRMNERVIDRTNDEANDLTKTHSNE